VSEPASQLQRVIETVASSVQETEALGERVGRALRAGDVVLLAGELGAGKTCFVRGLARGAGGDARRVASPTYVISHEYEGGRVTLVHVDAYRLDEGADLAANGIEAGESAALVIEWADRLYADAPAPEEALWVRLSHEGESARRAIIEGSSSWATRLGET
jgi:tRNA threonylcarbamoyladenosine biosynthesis protein TsaE